MNKTLNLIFAATTVAIVVVAHQLQLNWQLEPCPLCIAMRYAFLFVALIFIARAILPKWDKALRFSGLVGSAAGAGLAFKHLYVLRYPSSGCGRDALEGFINALPLADLLPTWFKATGMCGADIPPVLGLPFPAAALLGFAALAVLFAAPQLKPRLLG